MTWVLAQRTRLGQGNDVVYVKSRCFDPFPFPVCSDALKAKIRAVAEELDAHRKARQAEHPKLTLTQMYNVLEKLRAGVRPGGSDPGTTGSEHGVRPAGSDPVGSPPRRRTSRTRASC